MPKTFRFSFSGNNVEMSISGIQGSGCAGVSSAINRALGSEVNKQEFTDEFYNEPPTLTSAEQTGSVTN